LDTERNGILGRQIWQYVVYYRTHLPNVLKLKDCSIRQQPLAARQPAMPLSPDPHLASGCERQGEYPNLLLNNHRERGRLEGCSGGGELLCSVQHGYRRLEAELAVALKKVM